MVRRDVGAQGAAGVPGGGAAGGSVPGARGAHVPVPLRARVHPAAAGRVGRGPGDADAVPHRRAFQLEGGGLGAGEMIISLVNNKDELLNLFCESRGQMNRFS